MVETNRILAEVAAGLNLTRNVHQEKIPVTDEIYETYSYQSSDNLEVPPRPTSAHPAAPINSPNNKANKAVGFFNKAAGKITKVTDQITKQYAQGHAGKRTGSDVTPNRAPPLPPPRSAISLGDLQAGVSETPSGASKRPTGSLKNYDYVDFEEDSDKRAVATAPPLPDRPSSLKSVSELKTESKQALPQRQATGPALKLNIQGADADIAATKTEDPPSPDYEQLFFHLKPPSQKYDNKPSSTEL
ncbi:unnamed protein product [Owenia fusiformis]|nr:unnamed protein product [Owenia fusiformis]